MVDSSVVLHGQTLAYTLYSLAILSLMGWFGYKIMRKGEESKMKDGLFYTYVTLLVVLGVSLHIITYNTIEANANFDGQEKSLYKKRAAIEVARFILC